MNEFSNLYVCKKCNSIITSESSINYFISNNYIEDIKDYNKSGFVLIFIIEKEYINEVKNSFDYFMFIIENDNLKCKRCKNNIGFISNEITSHNSSYYFGYLNENNITIKKYSKIKHFDESKIYNMKTLSFKDKLKTKISNLNSNYNYIDNEFHDEEIVMDNMIKGVKMRTELCQYDLLKKPNEK